MAVTQHFTFELPFDAVDGENSETDVKVTLDRPAAESLYEELGEALYPGIGPSQQEPTPGFLEALRTANEPPFEDLEPDQSMTPDQAAAYAQAMAAREEGVHVPHTQGLRTSVLGSIHIDG